MEATRAPVKKSTDAKESSRGQESSKVNSPNPRTTRRVAWRNWASLKLGFSSLKTTSSATKSAVDANSESKVEVKEAKTTTKTKAAPPAPSSWEATTGKSMLTWGRSTD